MFGEEIFRIDLVQLYEMVGEIADRSSNDFDPHTADLSDWLVRNKIGNINDLEKIPPSGVKSFILSYLSGYEYKSVKTWFPRLDQIVYPPDPHMIEIVDLLIATTMLCELLGMEEGRNRPNEREESEYTDPGKTTQLVILGNKTCWLTLDSTTMPLIKAMTFMATHLDIKLDRAKKRCVTLAELGALDPGMRIRYDLMRHAHPSKLFEQIRNTRTPLQDLSRMMADWPCVFDSPEGLKHTRLGPALWQLKRADPCSDNQPRHKIVDSFDVIRMHEYPA